jgi:hypothetical protein
MGASSRVDKCAKLLISQFSIESCACQENITFSSRLSISFIQSVVCALSCLCLLCLYLCLYLCPVCCVCVVCFCLCLVCDLSLSCFILLSVPCVLFWSFPVISVFCLCLYCVFHVRICFLTSTITQALKKRRIRYTQALQKGSFLHRKSIFKTSQGQPKHTFPHLRDHSEKKNQMSRIFILGVS